MKITKCTVLSQEQKEIILQLWNAEYPRQLSFLGTTDFENYLRVLDKPVHYLAANEDAIIAAWAFTFERENERWFAIIVSENYHKRGLGTQLLNALKEDEAKLNGWVTDNDNYTKANGEKHLSPKQFYLKNGFVFCDDVRLETDRLSAIKIKWKLPKNNI